MNLHVSVLPAKKYKQKKTRKKEKNLKPSSWQKKCSTLFSKGILPLRPIKNVNKCHD